MHTLTVLGSNPFTRVLASLGRIWARSPGERRTTAWSVSLVFAWHLEPCRAERRSTGRAEKAASPLTLAPNVAAVMRLSTLARGLALAGALALGAGQSANGNRTGA